MCTRSKSKELQGTNSNTIIYLLVKVDPSCRLRELFVLEENETELLPAAHFLLLSGGYRPPPSVDFSALTHQGFI